MMQASTTRDRDPEPEPDDTLILWWRHALLHAARRRDAGEVAWAPCCVLSTTIERVQA